MQREISDLRTAHSRLAAEGASVGATNKVFEDSLCLLQKEVEDFRRAQAREILSSRGRLPV
jgi:hypothetical protein